jgi:ABC-2 type transport system permease protein
MKNKVLIVAGYEIRKTVRKKAFLFVSIVVPMLLVAVVFVALPILPSLISGLGGAVGFGNTTIGYVDTLDYLEPPEGFIEFPDEAAARAALDSKNVTSYFTLAQDYPRNNTITIYTAGTVGFSDPRSQITGLLRASLMKHWGIPGNDSDLILSPYNASIVNLESGGAIGTSGGAFEFILPYGFAMLLLLSIMMSSSYLMQGIGEEKENKTGELLLSSISADQLLRGKILGYGGAGLFQTGMFALAGILVISLSPLAPLFYGLQFNGIIGLGFLYFLLGYALFASSIAMTASISSSAKEAQQTSTLFTLLAAIPIMFITLIINDPNSTLAQVLTYIPYTSPFVMMMRMSLTAVSWLEIAISLSILVATIFVMSKLAGRIFRMGMLKYDRRAGLREVLSFIREK